jgi:hypothetical protein
MIFMKLNSLLLLSFLSVYTASAQLVITSGAQVSLTGNTKLTLQNTDLVNNGSFAAGNSMVTFTGNAASSISGSQPVQFFEMEMNKSNLSSVILQRPIGITQRILFTSGFLDLNGSNADLGSTGHLDGEQENSRVTGANGGEVLFNVQLNSPTGSNPANLGIFITSNQNLGNVTIKRGHQSQTTIPGNGNTILRYYDLIPTNNTNPDATLRFSYFDGELNNLAENSLVFFNSSNTINWSNLGFTSRDAAANFAEKTGISSFGRFTLSSIATVLPVRFILFNAKCEAGKVLVTWKTAQEQNSSHFTIESSTDGFHWNVIGSLSAAGYSDAEKSYSYTDNNPAQNGFYRIAEYDLGGIAHYTNTIRSSCNIAETLKVWPNPFHDVLFVTIVAANDSQAAIKVFNSKGALVKVQSTTVLQGTNQLSIDMSSLANGAYSLSIDWNNGQMKKTVQVIKH